MEGLFTVGIGKQPLIFQKVTYLVTRRIDQIDPKTWLILGFWLSLIMVKWQENEEALCKLHEEEHLIE